MANNKDAFWFPHDSNASTDPKCMLLIDQLGPEGYGIYWMLVETLRDQRDYKCPLFMLPALARRFNTTHQKVEAVVRGYGLFEFDNNDFFFSKSLIERMSNKDAKREQARLAAQIRWQKREENLLNSTNEGSKNDADAMRTHNERIADAMHEQCDRNAIRREEKRKENKRTYKGLRLDDFFVTETVETALCDFIDMRITVKAKPTQRALDNIVTKIKKMTDNEQEQVAILQQSVTNGWKDIYELKDRTILQESAPIADCTVPEVRFETAEQQEAQRARVANMLANLGRKSTVNLDEVLS